MSWSRSLAWAGWIMFAVSFFLPATSDMRGWQCAEGALAGLCEFYPRLLMNFRQIRTYFADIHLASLTFANISMILSPLLMLKRSRDARPWNWELIANLAAFILVWSFYLRWLLADDKGDMRIGYHLWTLSFLLVFLSSILRVKENRQRPILDH